MKTVLFFKIPAQAELERGTLLINFLARSRFLGCRRFRSGCPRNDKMIYPPASDKMTTLQVSAGSLALRAAQSMRRRFPLFVVEIVLDGSIGAAFDQKLTIGICPF